jgi:DNA-binding response OmpR family regulator
MTRLLVIEDDPNVGGLLQRGLRQEGFDVTLLATGASGIEAALTTRHDAIVLDLLLPDVSGLEVCRRLRAGRVDAPILMLTALDATENIVDGLRAGADDYLTKPFDVVELLARLDALIRRSQRAGTARLLQVGELTMDLDRMLVRYRGSECELTAREFAVLELLMRAPGTVHSRTDILDAAWGSADDPLTNIVDVYIRRLRQKIDVAEPFAVIRTVRGRGYKIQAETPAGTPPEH